MSKESELLPCDRSVDDKRGGGLRTVRGAVVVSTAVCVRMIGLDQVLYGGRVGRIDRNVRIVVGVNDLLDGFFTVHEVTKRGHC